MAWNARRCASADCICCPLPVFAHATPRSHDRAFLDAVATDIIHQHSGRLDYYKGYLQNYSRRSLTDIYDSNFTQFYSTKSERERNLRREYETQMEYRKHLQAFIDRWRYNANRAAQAQSKIKILEKVKVVCFSRHFTYLRRRMQLPELTPPVAEETEKFRCVKSSSWMHSKPSYSSP